MYTSMARKSQYKKKKTMEDLYSSEESARGSPASLSPPLSDGEQSDHESEDGHITRSVRSTQSAASGSDDEVEHDQNESDGERSVHSNAGEHFSGESVQQSDAESEIGNAESERGEVESEQGAESERGDAESERGDAESERGEIESEKGEIESEKGEVESERGDAESDRGDAESDKGDAESDKGDAESESASASQASDDEGSARNESDYESHGAESERVQQEESDNESQSSRSGYHRSSDHEEEEDKEQSDAEGKKSVRERSDDENAKASDADEAEVQQKEMSSDDDDDVSKRRKIMSSDDEHSAKGDSGSESIQHEVRKRKRTVEDDLFSAEESDGEAPKKTEEILQNDSDADSDIQVRKGKRKKVQRHSDDENEASHAEATVHDLFGGDLSSEDEDAGKEESTAERPIQNGFIDSTEPMEGEEEPEEPVPETRIEVEIPRITANLGREIHFIKMPNFLSVDTRPYEPQTYEDEIDEDEVLDEEGRARLKLKVENTIRWRRDFDDEGNEIKESNARIVRWSDGSLSLHLGSEIFDVYRQTLMPGDHNHLYIRQGTGLQGQAVFRTKLTFRPHSTDSFTHRKMTLSLADRNQKTQKIRVLPNVGQDPEAHRSEMIKKEEDRLKASIRRESKQRRMKEKSHSRGLNASYLEPDDDDDGAISLAAIKNRYKKGGSAAVRERPSIYSSEDELSDDDQKAKRLEKAKSDGGVGAEDNEDDDDDSDLDYFDKKKQNADGKKKAAAIEESDEDT